MTTVVTEEEAGVPLPTNGTVSESAYLDRIVFKKRNPIIMRSLCLMFGIVVYGCMSIEAWTWTYNAGNDRGVKTKKCLYGEDSEGVCTFGIFVSFVATVASIFFLGGEFVIEKPSFLKYRKRFYFTDLIFSGSWTFLYFVCFCVLESQWTHTEKADMTEFEQAAEGAASSVRAAIWFSFLSIPVWGVCTYMALQRYRVMKAEAEYVGDTTGPRRPSAYPTTVNVTGSGGPTTVTF